jgi:hypothetical protein
LNKDDRAYLIEILGLAYLSDVGIVDNNRAYGMNVRVADELTPVIVPYIQSIRGTKILTGVLGVAERRETKHNKFGLLLSEHVINFPELSVMHELFVNKSNDVRWCKIVLGILRDLPTNRPSIQSMIDTRASIHGVSILDMIHQENS